MTKVHFSIDRFGFPGVDQAYLEFVFQVASRLARQDPKREIGIALVNAPYMRRLNQKYRQQDKVSNVLSFVYREIQDPNCLTPGEEKNYLGDVYICHEKVMQQARAEKREPQEVFTKLLIHGILHLFGFHHEKSVSSASRMEALEDKISKAILD